MCYSSCSEFVTAQLTAEEMRDADDMRRIFADLEIKTPEGAPTRAGVHLKAQKPRESEPARLDDVALYSIVKQRRVLNVTEEEALSFRPPFTVTGFLWGLLPEQIQTNGFRPLLRQPRRKP